MPKRMCSVDGCDKDAVARGWCSGHWRRWRNTGDPGEASLKRLGRRPGTAICALPECDERATDREWCHTHYERWRRHGDVTTVKRVGRPRVDGFVSYESAHRRIITEHGKAAQHLCIECLGPAHEWAYIYGDPREMSGIRVIRGRGLAAVWSGDPAYYQPMCRPCHKRFDAAHRKAS